MPNKSCGTGLPVICSSLSKQHTKFTTIKQLVQLLRELYQTPDIVADIEKRMLA
jgi:hypothetical protein